MPSSSKSRYGGRTAISSRRASLGSASSSTKMWRKLTPGPAMSFTSCRSKDRSMNTENPERRAGVRYGFIGLGHLGGHLAASLLKAGLKLTVHDIDRNLAGRHL